MNSIPHEERQSGPHTGPKGVRADHDYQQQIQLALKTKARADYNARMLAKAPTTTTYLQDAKEQELILQQQQQEELDDDDLKYFREKRLNELKRLKQGNHAIRQQQKLFGTYITIDADEYANEIDDEWKTIPVIIHIFDDSLPKCKELDMILFDLSQKYRLAKFIRVSANDLDFDLVGSPAILAYTSGILVANLVRIIDGVGSRFDIDAIEDILLRYVIFLMSCKMIYLVNLICKNRQNLDTAPYLKMISMIYPVLLLMKKQRKMMNSVIYTNNPVRTSFDRVTQKKFTA